VKGESGQPDTVDIQGDVGDEAACLIASEFKIPEEKITLAEGGAMKKGSSKK